jgi:uncharacterized membrane protein YcjF (UPF0283 family)
MKRAFLDKANKQMDGRYIYLPFIISLVFFSGILVYGQQAGSKGVQTVETTVARTDSTESFLSALSVAVAILAVLATVAILIPTIMVFAQMRRIEKEKERFAKNADEADKRMAMIREGVKDFMHPHIILKKAK